MKKSIFALLLVEILLCTVALCGCEPSQEKFEQRAKYTDDGFWYHHQQVNVRTDGGTVEKVIDEVYILNFPHEENVVIPKTIDGYNVSTLGYVQDGFFTSPYFGYTVDASNVKTLTVQHYFWLDEDTDSQGNPIGGISPMPKLEKMIYVDFFNYMARGYLGKKLVEKLDPKGEPYWEEESRFYITIQQCQIGNESFDCSESVTVHLKRSDAPFGELVYQVDVVKIPAYVTQIDAGVFDGLNVKIQTEHQSQPSGWADGWNGTCQVEWGVEL